MTVDLTKKHPMYGASAERTLDELVEQLVPEYPDELPRLKRMSRYQTLYHLFRTMRGAVSTTEFGSPEAAPEFWYVICKAMERAQQLNEALITERKDAMKIVDQRIEKSQTTKWVSNIPLGTIFDGTIGHDKDELGPYLRNEAGVVSLSNPRQSWHVGIATLTVHNYQELYAELIIKGVK
ncbi:hypothetical protein LCGC14_0392070 [marine sediment metagenome]|uniref:Uncharacterized protein n=1 Tax=marine sediment metagenome TaxID=412755 RepID=A0A0F9W8A4_9ZZZZ